MGSISSSGKTLEAILAAFGVEDQTARFGARMRNENVWRVDFSERTFKLWSEAEKESTLARAVVIATGGKTKWLGVEGEFRLMGRGVSGCATCDAFFFRDRRVAVVGGETPRWRRLSSSIGTPTKWS